MDSIELEFEEVSQLSRILLLLTENGSVLAGLQLAAHVLCQVLAVRQEALQLLYPKVGVLQLMPAAHFAFYHFSVTVVIFNNFSGV